MADKKGRDKIKLQHRVQRIVQNTKRGVKVYCNTGESFIGDKIICIVTTFSAKKLKWEPGLQLTR